KVPWSRANWPMMPSSDFHGRARSSAENSCGFGRERAEARVGSSSMRVGARIWVIATNETSPVAKSATARALLLVPRSMPRLNWKLILGEKKGCGSFHLHLRWSDHRQVVGAEDTWQFHRFRAPALV